MLLLCSSMIAVADDEMYRSVQKSNEATAIRHVTDHMGRDVAMPIDPKRIVALNSQAMETLFAIGITPVAKVDDYNIREEGMNLPSVGGALAINIEKIHEVAPDLILAHKRNHGQLVQALEQTGAAVYVFDPGKFGDKPMFSVYEFFGGLFERQAQAEAYIASIKELGVKLREEVRSKTGLSSGVVLQPGDRVSAAQNANFYSSIINALGLTNIIPKNDKESFVTIDAEAILSADPDFIFIRATGPDAAQNDVMLHAFCEDPKWSGLTAVRNGRVRILPFKVNPNKSSPDQALRLAAQEVLSSGNQ